MHHRDACARVSSRNTHTPGPEEAVTRRRGRRSEGGEAKEREEEEEEEEEEDARPRA